MTELLLYKTKSRNELQIFKAETIAKNMFRGILNYIFPDTTAVKKNKNKYKISLDDHASIFQLDQRMSVSAGPSINSYNKWQINTKAIQLSMDS